MAVGEPQNEQAEDGEDEQTEMKSMDEDELSKVSEFETDLIKYPDFVADPLVLASDGSHLDGTDAFDAKGMGANMEDKDDSVVKNEFKMDIGQGSEQVEVASGNRENNSIEGGVEGGNVVVVQMQNGGGLVKADEVKGSEHEQLQVSSVIEHKIDGHESPVVNEWQGKSYLFDYTLGTDDAGTEEEQAEFMKELERFHKEKCLEFKAPKFYGEGLNCLKLWRQVTGLGGYDQVTSGKLWRQVGESFKPPKTCTTVSWTFRNFYEKALLEYEKYKVETGEFQAAASSLQDRGSSDVQGVGNQASGPGRARRDAATRAMQGWHSQRFLGNGEIGDPIIKDKGAVSLSKKDKNIKSSGSIKRKRTSSLDQDDRLAMMKPDKLQADSMVIDLGAPADWVKINVRRTKECFEIYALVPGLLREEVQVQSDPVGRLIISGEPEQPDNPWGVTPFKKVITLPSRIDPHQTSAVVTLHGQLFVRAPFEQSKS